MKPTPDAARGVGFTEMKCRGAGQSVAFAKANPGRPQVLVPVLAIPLLAIGGSGENYSALFIAAIVFGVLGALSVLPIKSVK